MSKCLGAKDVKRNFLNVIDRQGIPSIPPVGLLAGAATTVAVGGVLQQTGVIDSVLNAVSQFISMLIK